MEHPPKRPPIEIAPVVDLTGIAAYVSEEEIAALEPRLRAAQESLENRTGPGSDFMGWYHYPTTADRDVFAQVNAAADKIRKESEVLVVIGIGGSYLGAHAAIDAFCPNPEKVIFLGQTLSDSYTSKELVKLEGREFSVFMVSKSGTTTEPALLFRIVRKMLVDRYGKDADSRIYTATSNHGLLYEQSVANGWTMFFIPEDIGGRYSVLTPAGLLPMIIAGANPIPVMMGSAKMEVLLTQQEVNLKNPAWRYAAARYLLAEKGFDTELLVNYEPSMHAFAEWYKQLFGESEGKDGTGVFPAAAQFSTDLHSLGQYIQDGPRRLIETTLRFEKSTDTVTIPDDGDANSGRTLAEINELLRQGVKRAHVDGGVPCIDLTMPGRGIDDICGLFYFFQLSCALYCILCGINPFNQPGVEAYKQEFKKML